MDAECKTDFRLVAEIINHYFQENGYSSVHVDEAEIDWQAFVDEWGHIASIDYTNSYWTRFFDYLSEDRSRTTRLLNHYKCPQIAKAILESGCFHASHLPAHSANDSEEYYHYLRQVGHPLVTGRPIHPKTLRHYPHGMSTVEQMRDEVYILCFTEDEFNPFFWREYACKSSGVRFRLRYTPTGANQTDETAPFPLFHLRKMFYDFESNDRMSFIDRMNDEVIINTMGDELLLNQVYLFSTFYKRYGYTIENETRLSFDLSYLRARNSYPYDIDICEDGSRNYIEIPIENQVVPVFNQLPFDIELVEVICGQNMSGADFDELHQIVNTKYIDVAVVRDSESV